MFVTILCDFNKSNIKTNSKNIVFASFVVSAINAVLRLGYVDILNVLDEIEADLAVRTCSG